VGFIRSDISAVNGANRRQPPQEGGAWGRLPMKQSPTLGLRGGVWQAWHILQGYTVGGLSDYIGFARCGIRQSI
jgi:hypothetical protein